MRKQILAITILLALLSPAGAEVKITSRSSEASMTINFDDPVKQTIWNTIREMNDSWTKGNPERLTEFFHRNMVAITPSEHDRLIGGDVCVSGWKTFCANARIHYFKESDPSIQVYGDSAVVTYIFDMSFDMNGQTIQMKGRDMFFLIKENGKWWIVADQFSEFPS